MPAKIRRGDKVMILSGKDKGRNGEVLRILVQEGKALVQGINQVRRHTKPTKDEEGGIKIKEMPMALSKLAIIDPKDNTKSSRVGFKKDDKGKLRRFAKLSGEWIDKD